jgi:diguanylate cyclase (GGDEF)-like protein
VDYRLIHADGSVRRVTEHGRVIRDTSGNPMWLDGVILDTTKQKQAEDERDRAEADLMHQALHDGLTGLPNRTLVLDRAEQMLLRCRRGSALPTAMFIDLDDFKAANDSLGHQAGDELLQAVATRLSDALRPEETIGRLGGDEFVILTEIDSNDPRPERIADRLLDVLSEPFLLEGYLDVPLTISASIGIATGNRPSAQELLQDADIALYRAKAQGKHCHIEFEPQMRIDVVDRLGLEIDLRSALDRQEFFLVYQPILDLKDGHVCSVEALLRWRHPARGVVGPTDFVPMLEQTGMIIPVGKWVLIEACREAAVWCSQGHRTGVAVNVSVRQLETNGFVQHVREALSISSLDPSLLTLEITESTLMLDTQMVVERLKLLKQAGVRIAIDDFGTGYSSLAYLRQFPVDTLKIDRSFVAALHDTPESLAFITTFIELGQIFGLETLAEGIETTDHLQTLREINCGQGQGFLISTPVGPSEIGSYLSDMHRSLNGDEATTVQVI